MEAALKRMRNARLLLIPGSAQTVGHGTTAQARWWKTEFATWLAQVPRGNL
jgi:homoserine O-acetyltransferase